MKCEVCLPGMRGYVIYSLGTAPCPQGTGKYIDLARAKSEAPINSNL